MAATPDPTLATGGARGAAADAVSRDATRQRVRNDLRANFPSISDHPDVAGLLRDPALVAELGPALAAPFANVQVDIVVAPEARGPMLGALVAQALGVGLVVIRKDDRNHPGADTTLESRPTWRGRSETFIARSFDLEPGVRALVVDDWVTTGSSLAVARSFVEGCAARYVGASVIVNKATPDVVADLAVEWLVTFDEAMVAGRLPSPR